ncbi:MAG: VOC family protein [Acidiferrobacter sp.]
MTTRTLVRRLLAYGLHEPLVEWPTMQVLRAYVRIYLAPSALDDAITFYEAVTGELCALRFSHPDAGLEVAAVGALLLIAGPPERLAPIRATQMTLLVDNLDAARDIVVAAGALIIEEPRHVPTGRNMRVRHPDDTICEYVEHTGGTPG